MAVELLLMHFLFPFTSTVLGIVFADLLLKRIRKKCKNRRW